ncbi:LOW QUALITY PROTEIN: hypothetical protein Cgig2_018727 [Carnegiea gigantea]|uniref:DUF4283 domain-containing protein n=1 Tax=Carnegiea gigantea TaxID=171969 RepID=A0A9Q1GN24_9CARY|nr:LOW QUALITY PROTEIN: hypothetical protein Cgig2_018727 [Carnegiea gigantea]
MNLRYHTKPHFYNLGYLLIPIATHVGQGKEIQSIVVQETHQEEILAIESNGTVPREEGPPNIQVKSASSYASLVDPEDGTHLKFVSAEIMERKSPKSKERMWKPRLNARKGVFLIRFGNIQDKLAVEKRGIYYFDAKSFLVKGWNPQMDLQTENLKSLPIWVQLPELDIKFLAMTASVK